MAVTYKTLEQDYVAVRRQIQIIETSLNQIRKSSENSGIETYHQSRLIEATLHKIVIDFEVLLETTKIKEWRLKNEEADKKKSRRI